MILTNDTFKINVGFLENVDDDNFRNFFLNFHVSYFNKTISLYVSSELIIVDNDYDYDTSKRDYFNYVFKNYVDSSTSNNMHDHVQSYYSWIDEDDEYYIIVFCEDLFWVCDTDLNINQTIINHKHRRYYHSVHVSTFHSLNHKNENHYNQHYIEHNDFRNLTYKYVCYVWRVDCNNFFVLKYDND